MRLKSQNDMQLNGPQIGYVNHARRTLPPHRTHKVGGFGGWPVLASGHNLAPPNHTR